MKPVPRRTPTLDPWREELVLALRAHDVLGTRIGEALAEVDAHCAESGQSPEQAFGPPDVYGASLAAALGPEASTPGVPWWWSAGLGAASGGGALLLLAGVEGVSRGRAAELDGGMLVAFVLITAGGASLPSLLPWLLRRGHRRYLFLALFGLMLLPALVADRVGDLALRLPAAPVAVAGSVFLLAGLVAMTRATPDLVIDPRTGRDALPTPAWVGTALAVVLPLVVLVAVAVVVSRR